ncbi:hypothetical protein V6C03_08790 [Methyloligella sp. 2.7D]|uniref:hypothetical protein n=1 Tax=unclassified Methyloligella TaxID=2625955 RepID=UPI00157CC062|nr:hypothetical protein [Methyloligella sp. GL2]QKP78036.1 hypothetical protein HT051_11660 [Methyloligella sp. GL2]
MLRIVVIAVLVLAAAGLVAGPGQAAHRQPDQAAPQQQDDITDNIAEAGEDLVNVVVNVGRTASRAITHLFDERPAR